MAVRLTKQLRMPDMYDYQFIGRTWFGVCTTNASTRVKTVNIPGFTSSDLINGTRVVVQFSAGQTYNGHPALNVSSTSNVNIMTQTGSGAGQNEWASGEIVGFIYYNSYWVMEDGGHATTSYWGKTKLDSWYSDYNDRALSSAYGKSLAQNIYGGLIAQQIKTDEGTYRITLLDSETPVIGSWTLDGNTYTYVFLEEDLENTLSYQLVYSWYTEARMFKITYGDDVFCYPLSLAVHNEPDENVYFNYLEGGGYFAITYNYSENTITIETNIQSMVGQFDIKIEYMYSHDYAGIITVPLLEDRIKDFLTLEDLPIYNGQVV